MATFHFLTDYEIALVILQILSCIYILVRSVQAVNRMSWQTRTTIRCAYLILCAGAAYGIVSCLPSPDTTAAVLAAGVALFLHGDMRHVQHA